MVVKHQVPHQRYVGCYLKSHKPQVTMVLIAVPTANREHDRNYKAWLCRNKSPPLLDSSHTHLCEEFIMSAAA